MLWDWLDLDESGDVTLSEFNQGIAKLGLQPSVWLSMVCVCVCVFDGVCGVMCIRCVCGGVCGGGVWYVGVLCRAVCRIVYIGYHVSTDIYVYICI